jgi:predicted metal-dependent HD superfamily phosphohydrolase
MEEKVLRECMTCVRLPEAVQTFIVDEMSAPHRHYHTIEHLLQVWNALVLGDPRSPSLMTRLNRETLGCALFFHDIVYDVHAKDNEERSAIEARLRLDPAEYNVPLICELIHATKTHDLGRFKDRATDGNDLFYRFLMADCSILWSQHWEYERYAHNIRKEYAFVPADQYRVGREKVLLDLADSLSKALEPDSKMMMNQMNQNIIWEIGQLHAGQLD